MAPDVSVVISTYNRRLPLAAALDALLSQRGDVEYEIIVVDNNCSDGTREMVQSLAARNPKVHYLLESRQGISYGRNTGIATAQALILAFTDDDVQPAPDWVLQIKAGFAAHPEVDYIGGKVLPQWTTPPPAWLTSAHWSPLALVDYGNQPFYVDPDRPLCLVGANMAFRRRAFGLVGLFKPDFQRVKDGIGSLEDYEMQSQLWGAGRRGMYLPALLVTAPVDAQRLEKDYHRRWHAGHGRFHALLPPAENLRHKAHLFGVPAYLYKRATKDAFAWAASALRNRPEPAFEHELRLRFFGGFARQRWREYFRW